MHLCFRRVNCVLGSLDSESTYSASTISVSANSSSVNELARDWIFPSLTPIQHLLYFVSDHISVESSEARYLMSLAVTTVALITTKSKLGAMFSINLSVSQYHSIKLKEGVELG